MIPVPYIEYINVRIKGYRSRLFTRDIYDNMTGGDNLGALTTFLLDQNTYSADIERALEKLPEREALELGVTNHFARSVSDILHMGQGKIRSLYETVLYSFDMKNIRTAVIARSRGLSYEQTCNRFIPCGSLGYDDLFAMFAADDIEGIFSVLTTKCSFYTQALSDARRVMNEKEHLVIPLNKIELTMYREIAKHLERNDHDTQVVRNIFRLEIDMKNIIKALKHVWDSVEPAQDDTAVFIQGGNIGAGFLTRLSQAESIDEAFEMVESTPFRSAVEKGIIYYAETGFLHEMEHFFEEVFIQETQSSRRFDPFGVGVFLGYVWAQFTEMINLRTIINGIAFRTGIGQIRKGLMYV